MPKRKKCSKKIDWYKAEEIMLENVQVGDTLELVPRTGGKYPIPPEISATAKNTIFFRNTTSGWLYLPIKKLKIR